MILRIEDTDQSRFVEGAEQYIVNSLKWCGIDFDESVVEGGGCGPYKQSERKKISRSVITTRSEANYQAKLVKKYEKDGYEVIKLLKTNKNGYPDLLLLKPNEVRFVEVKALKGRLSKIQEYRIKDLRSKGFPVEVARSPD